MDAVLVAKVCSCTSTTAHISYQICVRIVPPEDGQVMPENIDRLVVGSGPKGPDAPRPYMSRPFVPQSFPHRIPAALLKRQIAPRF
jgi:hypothetical protein